MNGEVLLAVCMLMVDRKERWLTHHCFLEIWTDIRGRGSEVGRDVETVQSRQDVKLVFVGGSRGGVGKGLCKPIRGTDKGTFGVKVLPHSELRYMNCFGEGREYIPEHVAVVQSHSCSD